LKILPVYLPKSEFSGLRENIKKGSPHKNVLERMPGTWGFGKQPLKN